MNQLIECWPALIPVVVLLAWAVTLVVTKD